MCRLLNRKPTGAPLNISVLACSKGAEVYSILWAIRSARPDLKFDVHAIDISQEIVDFAKEGVYALARPAVLNGYDNGSEKDKLTWNTYRDQGPQEAVSMLERMTDKEIEEMLELNRDQVRIRPWLKEGITWRTGDAADPELVNILGPQDIVVANRFLCHMPGGAAENCLRNIAKLVKPGGYLFVSGIDLDIRTRVARELGWEPVSELLKEVHDGDPSLASGWPMEWWGLEPYSEDAPDYMTRYASVFRTNATAPVDFDRCFQPALSGRIVNHAANGQ